MAQFYGTLIGQAGQATRCGSKASGLEAVAASWHGAIRVYIWHEDGRDHFRVVQATWHSQGIHEDLGGGILGEPKS